MRVKDQAKKRLEAHHKGEFKECEVCFTQKPLTSFGVKHRGRHRTCKECKSHLNRLTRFGLTPGDYFKLLDYQHYRCGICESELEFGKNSAVIDHCHKTNEIRGILCRQCNTAIGFFQEDHRLFRKAMGYINEPVARNVVERKTVKFKFAEVRRYFKEQAAKAGSDPVA